MTDKAEQKPRRVRERERGRTTITSEFKQAIALSSNGGAARRGKVDDDDESFLIRRRYRWPRKSEPALEWTFFFPSSCCYC